MYKMCLNSSYKFASKKINKNIIKIIVDKIDPSIIVLELFEKILFSINGNSKKPKKVINGSLKNNQMKI